MTPELLGPYRLDGPIGAPDAAVPAHDRLRRRDVDLYVFAEEPPLPHRLRTWNAVRTLEHPAALPILDIGRLGGRTFVATRRSDGTDLARRVSEDGPLPPVEAVGLVAELADLLDAVHQAGGVHGAINPGRVVRQDGGWRLSGFAVGPAPSPRPVDDIRALCALLLAIGGPNVAAPESAAALARTLRDWQPTTQQPTTQQRANQPWWVPPAVPVTPPAPVPATPAVAFGRSTWWAKHEHGTHPIRGRLTIGRDPTCDIVVDDLTVSGLHAELSQTGAGWVLLNRGRTGTFVNGRRIDRALVSENDMIGMGSRTFRMAGGRLVEYRDDGDVTFSAHDLVVTTKSGKVLLDGVSFALPERCLLAIIGPSGAGKTTLLRALTGERPADSGHVEYAGRDLYQHFEELNGRIGVVPQDDILHRQLRVRTALRYAAELRFPAGSRQADRDRRVDEVLTELGLESTARQPIHTLSGGQRKRTSLALELLTQPSLLFLDEPTTGLDPGHRQSVVRTLRMLADGGRTVITVTHDENSLQECDRLLVLARGGKLAYFGSPAEALAFFGVADFPAMFDLLDDDTADWKARFGAAHRVGPHSAHGSSPRQARPQRGPAPRRQSAARQFGTLTRRYLHTIAADHQYSIFLAGLPLVIGGVAHIMPGDAGLSWTAKAANQAAQGTPQTLLLVIMVGAAFAGFAGAFRELVKEREIYRREQTVGVGPMAYLSSKLVVLGVITAVQAVLIAVVGTMGKQPPDTPVVFDSAHVEITVAIIASALTLMALGLLVSALIDNADRGMPLLVVIFLVQFVLCGMLFQPGGLAALGLASWFVPARWSFAMGAITCNFPPTGSPPPGVPIAVPVAEDPLWHHTALTWWLDLGALTLLAVAFAAGTAVALARLNPLRRRGRPLKGRLAP